MKEIIGTSTYMFSLFPKKFSNKLKNIKLTREVKVIPKPKNNNS